MRPWAFAAVIAATFPGVVIGQSSQPITSVRISGRILDASGAPIPNASVRLRLTSHKETVSTTVADLNGAFTCGALSPNDYDLSVEQLGFQSLVKSIHAEGTKDIDLGHIVLNVGLLDGSPGIFADAIEPSGCCDNDKEPIKTTLCDLAKTPERFQRKVVELRTAVYPFGVDTGTRLFDPSCSANVLLETWHERSLQTDQAYQFLDYRMIQQQIVEATLLGRFEVVLVIPGGHYFRFILQMASDVVVKPIEKK